MVEPRSPMVAWLRKMVKRSSIDASDEAPPVAEGSETIDNNSASSASGNSQQTSELTSLHTQEEPTSTISTHMLTVDRGNTSAPRQRPNLQDSASVMTIASSSKRRRQSLDTNASTRALAAESVFSWSAEKERERETPGPSIPAPDRGAHGTPHEQQRPISERVASSSSQQ